MLIWVHVFRFSTYCYLRAITTVLFIFGNCLLFCILCTVIILLEVAYGDIPRYFRLYAMT